MVIPSLAIHVNRNANDSLSLNPAVDMIPLLSSEKCTLEKLLSDELGMTEDEIVSHDLFLRTRYTGESAITRAGKHRTNIFPAT